MLFNRSMVTNIAICMDRHRGVSSLKQLKREVNDYVNKHAPHTLKGRISVKYDRSEEPGPDRLLYGAEGTVYRSFEIFASYLPNYIDGGELLPGEKMLYDAQEVDFMKLLVHIATKYNVRNDILVLVTERHMDMNTRTTKFDCYTNRTRTRVQTEFRTDHFAFCDIAKRRYGKGDAV